MVTCCGLATIMSCTFRNLFPDKFLRRSDSLRINVNVDRGTTFILAVETAKQLKNSMQFTILSSEIFLIHMYKCMNVDEIQ